MTDADKLQAAFKYLRATGASRIALRSSDNEQPVIWIVLAEYPKKNPLLANETEVEAALEPLDAALRLCERLTDGSSCSHCNRRAAFEANSLARMPYDRMLCWYQYDPEMKVFRRGCE